MTVRGGLNRRQAGQNRIGGKPDSDRQAYDEYADPRMYAANRTQPAGLSKVPEALRP